MSVPRVSVVIPTRNRAALVTQAIESVLAQSYRDFEVLVCDDGSTDNTAERVGRCGSPVRYLGLPHSGRPGVMRNHGIHAARGELVAFLDDDDLWEPDKLARQLELLDRSPDLNFAYTDRRIRTLGGEVSGHVSTPAPPRPDRLLDLVLNRQMPCICTVLVRRDLLQQIGGFDEQLVTSEDLDLMLRLAPLARAAGVPEALVEIRRQPGSVSEQAGVRAYDNAIAVLKRWRASVELPNDQQRLYRLMHAHLDARRARMEPWRPASWMPLLRALASRLRR